MSDYEPDQGKRKTILSSSQINYKILGLINSQDNANSYDGKSSST